MLGALGCIPTSVGSQCRDPQPDDGVPSPGPQPTPAASPQLDASDDSGRRGTGRGTWATKPNMNESSGHNDPLERIFWERGGPRTRRA